MPRLTIEVSEMNEARILDHMRQGKSFVLPYNVDGPGRIEMDGVACLVDSIEFNLRPAPLTQEQR